MRLGRSREALALLQDALQLDHGSTARHIIYGNLGHALVRLGRNEEAVHWLLAAREHSTGFSPLINRWLAIAYAHTGKFEDARRELQEYVRHYPTLTLRSLRHTAWPNAAIAEEWRREIEGLAIAGLRDHLDEDADSGLPIDAGQRPGDLNARTPAGAPGVSVIHTAELQEMLGGSHLGANQDSRPLVLSTMCSHCLDIAFPGAIRIPASAQQGASAEDRDRALKAWVEGLASDSQERPIVTLSWNAGRWHGRNLALRLVALGYRNVSWYRGGLEAWDAAGLPVKQRQGKSD